jgi:site-specific DNA-methyltransferase (adenine-specific)
MVDKTVRGFSDSGGASRFFQNFRYQAKASRKDRGEGNVHPTVKSVALMEWLVTLITPPNGVVLDPFMGSGTTGVATVRKGFNFIGIEREEAYFAIAKERIETSNFTQEHQLSLLP